MDHRVTGAAIRALREKAGMTQVELAAKLCVSDKAVSKWENGRGFPDVSLLEAIGEALHVSVPELLRGQAVVNRNRGGNILRSVFYVCPACGNVLFARGEAVVSCCGIRLPAAEAEEPDEEHRLCAERVEDEIFVSADHPMDKDHFLSFIACVTPDGCEIRPLYPEGSAGTRFFYRGGGWLYWHCSRHGLYRQRLRAGMRPDGRRAGESDSAG